MTLNDITIRTRALLGDPSYNATTIQNAANDFVNELFNNTRTSMMETSIELTGSASETTIKLPTDIMIWTTVYLTSPDVYDLRDFYMEYAPFMAEHADFATRTASKPYEWTQFAGVMRLSAPLSTDVTIQMDYIRTPKVMTGPGSKCELPDRYMELITRGTKARCLEVDENYDEAGAERDILAPLVTTFIRNESRGGVKSGPVVAYSRRRGLRLR